MFRHKIFMAGVSRSGSERDKVTWELWGKGEKREWI